MVIGTPSGIVPAHSITTRPIAQRQKEVSCGSMIPADIAVIPSMFLRDIPLIPGLISLADVHFRTQWASIDMAPAAEWVLFPGLYKKIILNTQKDAFSRLSSLEETVVPADE